MATRDSTYAGEASTLQTSVGVIPAKMFAVSAPVPHPTSSQRPFGGAASHARNSRPTNRLHRPMYGSYASPATQASPTLGIDKCPSNGTPWRLATALAQLQQGQIEAVRELQRNIREQLRKATGRTPTKSNFTAPAGELLDAKVVVQKPGEDVIIGARPRLMVVRQRPITKEWAKLWRIG